MWKLKNGQDSSKTMVSENVYELWNVGRDELSETS